MPSQSHHNGYLPHTTTRTALVRQFRAPVVALMVGSVVAAVVLASMIVTTWTYSSASTRVVYLDVLAALLLLCVSTYGELMFEWRVRRRLAHFAVQHVTYADVTAAQQQLHLVQAHAQAQNVRWMWAFMLAVLAPIILIGGGAPTWGLWVCFGLVVGTCIGYALQQLRLQRTHAESIALIAYDPGEED